MVAIKPDLLVPRRASVVIDTGEKVVTLEAEFSTERQAYRIDRIEVLAKNEEPLTSLALREITVQEYFTEHLQLAVTTSSGQPYELNDGPHEQPFGWFTHSPANYDLEIARVYVLARATLRKPLQAVADRFQVSQSTATRWVARLRAHGQID